MYCGKLGHIVTNYPKKQLSHTTQAISTHMPPIKNLGNENIQYQ